MMCLILMLLQGGSVDLIRRRVIKGEAGRAS